jgi:hypothetical protein
MINALGNNMLYYIFFCDSRLLCEEISDRVAGHQGKSTAPLLQNIQAQQY